MFNKKILHLVLPNTGREKGFPNASWVDGHHFEYANMTEIMFKQKRNVPFLFCLHWLEFYIHTFHL